ncbi:MAG TPA: phospholipid carrier-dependent glycosyltransferase, partial [Longimicrobium sp.]|nr:phospholipid carrier-dependent glycosyltransferase [Longimicrobium sp.]
METTLAAAPPRAEPAPVAAAAPRAASARALAAPALLLVAALLVYHPWAAAPLSVLDFSEFLPVLRTPGGPVKHFIDLAHYFAGHGRSAWVTYAWISLNWTLFGDWAVGWDLLRFALMSGVVALSYLFLRRVGCSPLGAGAGAALLVVASPGQEGWTRLTGEPLGLAALLGAALLALGYRGARRWPARALAIALLLALAVLAKEVLAVAALPVLILCACWRPGRGLGR